jgi:hypothetical protein
MQLQRKGSALVYALRQAIGGSILTGRLIAGFYLDTNSFDNSHEIPPDVGCAFET